MSRTLPVSLGGRAYDVVVGEGLLDAAGRLIAPFQARGRTAVVSDETVWALHGERLTAALAAAGITALPVIVPPGEQTKSFDGLADVSDRLLALELDRGDLITAFGGGVVGDLAGFAAATLLRGLPLVQVPTSLIAQVDSSIGGKTGINHARGKNLIGAFWPPRLVLTDTSTLATLPEREYVSGLAEVVKHALLSGGDFPDTLAHDWPAIAAREPEAVAALVHRAAAFKAAVVSADERESGPRAFLNLGHTFGHAIEKAEGYGRFTHGEAVALGLRAALFLSSALAQSRVLAPDAPLPAPFDRLDALAARIPTPPLSASTEALNDAMGLDKKRAEGGLRFVVLDAPGQPRLAADVPPDLVAAAWARARYVSAGSSPSVTVTE
ncbi:MAG TPA: 3-dehydroquinate synthase [Rhodothermales bacterium]|nr:3-dehydroquinate synthase [Rhodothermales bacterium]